MKVLEHGIAYHTAKCPRCNAYLGYVEKDVTHFATTDKIEDKLITIEKAYITCEECGETIVVYSKPTVTPVEDVTKEAEEFNSSSHPTRKEIKE